MFSWFPKTSVDERARVLALPYECRRVLAKGAIWLEVEYGYRPIRKSTYFHFNARVTKRRHMADDSLGLVAAELHEVAHYQQVLRVCTYRGGISVDAFDRCQSPVGVYVGLRYTSAATRLERYLDPLGRRQRNGAP